MIYVSSIRANFNLEAARYVGLVASVITSFICGVVVMYISMARPCSSNLCTHLGLSRHLQPLLDLLTTLTSEKNICAVSDVIFCIVHPKPIG